MSNSPALSGCLFCQLVQLEAMKVTYSLRILKKQLWTVLSQLFRIVSSCFHFGPVCHRLILSRCCRYFSFFFPKKCGRKNPCGKNIYFSFQFCFQTRKVAKSLFSFSQFLWLSYKRWQNKFATKTLKIQLARKFVV